MNRTQLVVDAVASGAHRELDKLEEKEKRVAAAMKEIGREAQITEYKVAESARRMQKGMFTQGGGYVAAGRNVQAYGMHAAAPLTTAVMSAGVMPYGMNMPATYAGSLGAMFTGRDRGENVDPHAARLRAAEVAADVRESAQARRNAAAVAEAKRELARFESDHAFKQQMAVQTSATARGIGVGAGFAGAYALTQTIESLQEAEHRVREFTNDFRKIGTLGKNIDDMTSKREQILAFSNAWGVASEQVVSGFYAIESAASGLSKKEQAELMTGALQFNRLQGTGLEDGAKAILKYKEIYSNTIDSIAQAKNRLAAVSDLGDLDYDKMSRFYPDLLSRGKAMQATDTEVGAVTIVATQKLGRTEKTLTSLGDVFMKMPQAAKQLGFEMGNLDQNLDALEKHDFTMLAQVFGSDVGTLRVLQDNRDEIGKMRTEIEKIGPAADVVGEKIKKMWGDMSLRYAEMQEIYDQIDRNLPLSQQYTEKFGQTDLDWKARKVGVGSELPQFLSWLREPLAWFETAKQGTKVGNVSVLSALFGGVSLDAAAEYNAGSSDPYKDKGQAIAAQALKQAGRTDIDPGQKLADQAATPLKDAARDLKEAAASLKPARNRNAHTE